MVGMLQVVGLDVHLSRTEVAILDVVSGQLWCGRVVGQPERVLDLIAERAATAACVYEAGVTGFALARQAAARGLDVRVVSAGQIPRDPSDRVKTDRRDAISLARKLAAGDLSFCRVPTLEQERFRDLVRAREQVRRDLMRSRQRLRMFLLRADLYYPGSAWTVAHTRWLDQIRFHDRAQTATFTDLRAAIEGLLARRDRLEQTLEELVPDSPFADTIARLRCFRGIDTLTAAGLCAEIGDFHRFQHPRFLAGCLGIVPSERTSGQRRRQGAITRAGSSHARRLLVEAAHHYRRPPAIGVTLRRRQHGHDPRLLQIAWNAQTRLHHRHQHLRGRGKPPAVTVIALARELSSYLWQAATMT